MKKLLLKTKNKKLFFAIVIFLFFFFINFVLAADVSASNTIKDGIIGFIKWLLEVIKLLVGYVFQISSLVFDNLLIISLNSNILDSDFVKVIWSSLRDFANIFFILGGLFLILYYMVNGSSAIKKNIIYLIIAVFAINFSLFASRLIIDAGNLTAYVFFEPISTIPVDKDGNRKENYFSLANNIYDIFDNQNQKTGDRNFKSIALSVFSIADPKNEFEQKAFNQSVEKAKKGDKTGEETEESITTDFIVFTLLYIYMYFFFAKAFFKAGFMFITRIAALIYYMASSPLWFTVMFIPTGGGGGGFSLFKSRWLVPIFSKSFCIAIYLFFIWLSVLVLTSPVVSTINKTEWGGEDKNSILLQTALILILKIIFIRVLMDQAETYGKKFCEGEFGSTFDRLISPAKKAFGFATTAASFMIPGAGLARAGLGALGNKLQGSANKRAGTRLGNFQMRTAMKLKDFKIKGNSFNEREKLEREKIEKIESQYSKENRETIEKNRYILNEKNVTGFNNEEHDKKYQGYISKIKNSKNKKEVKEAKKKAREMIQKAKSLTDLKIENKDEALKGTALGTAFLSGGVNINKIKADEHQKKAKTAIKKREANKDKSEKLEGEISSAQENNKNEMERAISSAQKGEKYKASIDSSAIKNELEKLNKTAEKTNKIDSELSEKMVGLRDIKKELLKAGYDTKSTTELKTKIESRLKQQNIGVDIKDFFNKQEALSKKYDSIKTEMEKAKATNDNARYQINNNELSKIEEQMSKGISSIINPLEKEISTIKNKKVNNKNKFQKEEIETAKRLDRISEKIARADFAYKQEQANISK